MLDSGRLRAPEHALLRWYRAGLAAVSGETRVAAALASRKPPDRIHLLAWGKAALAMARGAEKSWGSAIVSGLVVAPEAGECGVGLRAERVVGDHPVPGPRSLAAGEAIVRFCAGLPFEEPVLFLLSGGASALAEWPTPGIAPERLAEVNRWLLASGLPIAAMNAVRARFSRLKAGGLRRLLGARPVWQLVLSDVPGDELAVIGSGPLFPGAPSLPPAFPEAWLPSPVAETIPEWGGPPGPTETLLLAGNRDCLNAVADAARADAYSVEIVAVPMTGDAESFGRACGRWLADAASGSVRIWGGETTVSLPPSPGAGGRCQHLALAAAGPLAGHSGWLLAAGTDGCDGGAQGADDAVAGAWVNGDTGLNLSLEGYAIDAVLRRADSRTALAAVGALIETGPTDTHVGDVVIAWKP